MYRDYKMFKWLGFFCEPETCDVCYEDVWVISCCPYFKNHKWCKECDTHIYKCPFCRRDFKKEHIVVHTLFLETFTVNRPLDWR